METLQLPIEVKDLFSSELSKLEQHLSSSAQITSDWSATVGLADTAASRASVSLEALAGSLVSDGFNAGHEFFIGLNSVIGELNSHLAFAEGLFNSIGSLFGSGGFDLSSVVNELGSGVSNLVFGFQALSTMNPFAMIGGAETLLNGLSSLQDTLFGRGGLFGGPSDQEMIAQGAAELGSLFGDAFNDEAKQKFQQLLTELPRAASGGVDILAATWHPETVKEILENIDSFSVEMQNTWAQNLEDHVKPVLMSTLGFSESEAANLMAPLFNEILSKVEPGSPLDSELQRMKEWAESFGVSFSKSFTEASSAAETVGEKFGTSISEVEGNIHGLQQKLDGLRVNATNRMLFNMDMADAENSLKEKFKQMSIDGMSPGSERAETRRGANKQFRDWKQKARGFLSDGHASREELRTVTDSLGREERRAFLELVKLQQKRHDEAEKIRQQVEQQRETMQEMKAQRQLLQQMRNYSRTMANNSEKKSSVSVSIDSAKLLDVILGNGGDLVISRAVDDVKKYR